MAEWACGVTTVPERRGTLLPRTLGSLQRAGFPAPRLFADGVATPEEANWYGQTGCATVRCPIVRVAMNWTLGLWELYARQPRADFFAVFQDDVLVCRDAREYVERQKLWERGRVYL